MPDPKLHLRVTADTRKGAADVNRFKGSLGGLKGALTGLGAAFAVSEVYELGKALFDAAAGAAEIKSAFLATYPSIGGAVKHVNQLADSLGIAQSQAQDMMTTTGFFLQSVGATEQQSFKTSEAMLKWARDIASFKNAAGGAEEVLRDLRSAMVGNYEAVEKWVGSMTEGQITNAALSMGLISAKSDALDPYTQAMVAFILAQEKSIIAAGDYEATMDSAANQMQQTKKAWREATEQAGQSFMPALVKLLGVFNQLIQFGSSVAAVFTALPTAMRHIRSEFPVLDKMIEFADKMAKFEWAPWNLGKTATLKVVDAINRAGKLSRDMVKTQEELAALEDDTAEQRELAQSKAEESLEKQKEQLLEMNRLNTKLVDTDRKAQGQRENVMLMQQEIEMMREMLRLRGVEIDMIMQANRYSAQLTEHDRTRAATFRRIWEGMSEPRGAAGGVGTISGSARQSVPGHRDGQMAWLQGTFVDKQRSRISSNVR